MEIYVKESGSAMEKLIGSFKRSYGGRYRIKDKTISCYTKKQLKTLYPQKNYSLIGEYSPDNKLDKQNLIGEIDCGSNLKVSKYKSHNRILYSEKGFVGVEGREDSYVVLLKKMTFQRIVSLFLCVLLISGCVYFAANIDDIFGIKDVNNTVSELDLEEDAVEWKGMLPDEKNSGGVKQGIAIPGYKSITLEADKREVSVNFLNPQGNPCYFEISLILEDGTLLYKSKKIKPGMGLYKIQLNKPLAAGKYNATIKYDTFSLTDLSPLNGANVEIELIAT